MPGACLTPYFRGNFFFRKCKYLVWQIYEQRLDWFVLEDDRYVVLEPDADGIMRSKVFPGLFLAVDALLSGDMAKVSDVLQQGLQTAEHATFVRRLQEMK